MNFENKINHNSNIVAVIGHPIKHSFSPLMHNISFDILQLDYLYLSFDVPSESLKDALKGMIALGIKGFNVTIPHKEKIVDFLNDVSEEASVIGAVNTVVNENGILHGYNTDVAGIVETLLPFKDELAGSEVTIIGAGGAARAALYSLIRHFKIEKINIVNRTEEKAERLKEYFSAKMLYNGIKAYDLTPPDLIDVFNRSKLIINTTSIGMSPEEDDSPTTIPGSFNKDQIIFDVVYNPLETKFLQLAKSQGAVTLNGLRMFVEQGAKAFELWTGHEMPKDKIYKTLQSYLGA
ncbi:MAG: shikimate dehydrogenase [Melioribacteraceae bacterium]|nr:shikimate dehydrogenase [Ignavibacteriota bacterium]MBZ0181463.1 shikimate dehydrogenase [Melioribacteraceae bacterium]